MTVSETPVPAPTGIAIIAIDHVGIAVPDLEAAIAFHTGTLGGVLAHRERNEEQGVEEAMIAYGDGAQVQLLAPLTADSTIARFLERNGPGLQQLAYRVADVRLAARAARAAGIRTLYDEPRRGTGGSSINFLHPKDAGGVLVELVEPAVPRDGIGVANAEDAVASGTMVT
jgi:methylmalonyl-CoA/ethylmalonyl-CoA epimerase